ncbi:MAG: hypothetical protein AAF449_10845, partial [Myxococcota bacterium]
MAVGCLPQELVEIPSDVDWVARIWPRSAFIVPERLRPAADINDLDITSTEPHWWVGFTQQQLADTGISAPELTEIFEGPACATAFAEPLWYHALNQIDPPPLLTSTDLPQPRGCEGGAQAINADSFTSLSFELPDTQNAALFALGHSDKGEMLFNLSNGDLYSADSSTVTLEASGLFYLTSIVRKDWEYWAVEIEGSGARVHYGTDPENWTSSYGYSDEPRNTTLHIGPNGDVIMVRGGGRDICWIKADRCPDCWIEHSRCLPLNRRDSFERVDVINDPLGGMIIASDAWSWRLDNGSLESRL